MVEKTDLLYLNHMRDACAQIQKYLDGVDKDKFETEKLIQDGVIRQLEIVGEAARKVSVNTRSPYRNINWKDIVGMRDKLIHDYTGVDLDIVWESATKFVPELLKNIEEIL